MLELFPQYVRLLLEKGLALGEIPEAFRTAMQVCRLNDVSGAMLVSDHVDLDLRAGMRAGLRTLVARTMMPKKVRLALVGLNCGALHAFRAVKALADEQQIPCEVFSEEKAALEWLLARGSNVTAVR
jgi:hypothetical protein